jgi:hypothetical protein
MGRVYGSRLSVSLPGKMIDYLYGAESTASAYRDRVDTIGAAESGPGSGTLHEVGRYCLTGELSCLAVVDHIRPEMEGRRLWCAAEVCACQGVLSRSGSLYVTTKTER